MREAIKQVHGQLEGTNDVNMDLVKADIWCGKGSHWCGMAGTGGKWMPTS